jgi:3-hydroxyisobutyrate dehydrogenase-like beta-hydroxyacid dehydrogenase
MTVVDAPVPGGQVGAEAATLPIVCGGKHKAARGAQA